MALESNNCYKMQLKVYYEDVLQNWYLQIVEIDYDAIEILNGYERQATVKYKVNEEKKIHKKDIPQ